MNLIGFVFYVSIDNIVQVLINGMMLVMYLVIEQSRVDRDNLVLRHTVLHIRPEIKFF